MALTIHAEGLSVFADVPRKTLHDLNGDSDVLKKLDYAEKLLQSIRKALTSV